jgi:hypothetical protein
VASSVCSLKMMPVLSTGRSKRVQRRLRSLVPRFAPSSTQTEAGAACYPARPEAHAQSILGLSNTLNVE